MTGCYHNSAIYYFSGFDHNRNCTHIDCDGLQNVLIEDIDGSLTGSPRVVLSKGYSTCAIVPREMLTTTGGDKIQLEDIAPHKG